MQYEPELGQALFGQPHQNYAADELCEACMAVVGALLEAKLNLHPMENSGDKFDCDVFSAHAYSWGDDEQPWNFKWRNFRVSWYKYLGRGMTMNMPLSADMAAEMLAECIGAINATNGKSNEPPSRRSDNAER